MQWEMKNCDRCGKIFVSSGLSICPECYQKEEEQFQVVKKYLLEHGRASAKKVSEDTGVPVEVVTEFVRRGYLVGVDVGPDDLNYCALCKTPISKGRICANCQRALAGSNLGRTPSSEPEWEGPDVRLQKPTHDSGTRMYTMDLIRKKRL